MITDYLVTHHAAALEEILNATEDKLYSLYINFIDLLEAECEFANKILQRPTDYLLICEKDAVTAQEQLVQVGQSVKERIRIRITGIPVTIQKGEIGQFVTTTGVVARVSQPTALKLKMRYTCKKCSHETIVKLEWERQLFPETKECAACKSRSIVPVNTIQQEDCTDYQELKLQERNLGDCTYSVGLAVVLIEDLVDICKPGDQINITGVIIRRWKNLTAGKRAEATTMLLANNIVVQQKTSKPMSSVKDIEELFKNYWKTYEESPLVGRDNILASICPQLCGMYKLKLALAVILAGGVAKTSDTGTRVRGEPHMLLVGDPGTGKSQILRTASRLASRSVQTTGIGSTAAGLTAAAVKDSDGWHLEAGALVLADGGVCCIDEFTTMSQHDLASVHEAMEQQTISIAKAGLMTTLNSRCTVIAAINPVGGRFVDGKEIETRIGKPLMSRFDLIFYLKDGRNKEWDRMMALHILKAAYENVDDKLNNSEHTKNVWDLNNHWEEDVLREYLSFIHSLKPQLTDSAKLILRTVFLKYRADERISPERKTVRLLDSLIRLAEGHARLMFRSKVLVMDAIVAVELVDSVEIFDDNIGCPFPLDPTEHYLETGSRTLRKLRLETLIGDL